MIFTGSFVDTTLLRICTKLLALLPFCLLLWNLVHFVLISTMSPVHPEISHHGRKKRKKKINPVWGNRNSMAKFTVLGKSLPNLSVCTLLTKRTSHAATTVQSTTCCHQMVTGEHSESASHWNQSDLWKSKWAVFTQMMVIFHHTHLSTYTSLAHQTVP